MINSDKNNAKIEEIKSNLWQNIRKIISSDSDQKIKQEDIK